MPYLAAMHCIAGVFIATDSQTDIVFRHPPLGDPYGAQVSDPSGWNIYDVRFAYDKVSDTGYFGECFFTKGARLCRNTSPKTSPDLDSLQASTRVIASRGTRTAVAMLVPRA